MPVWKNVRRNLAQTTVARLFAEIMKDEKIIYQGKTNVDGMIELNDLVYGIYKIKEVMASNGYLLNEQNIREMKQLFWLRKNWVTGFMSV